MGNEYSTNSTQTNASVSKNISFFRDQHHNYDKNVQEMDTYAAIRASVNECLQGVTRLLDVGNGGVFDYDTDLVPNIVALDLFLDTLSSDSFPKNITCKTGSALDIPEPDASFDAVLLAMLIHHLVGPTIKASLENVRQTVSEAFRVLQPGGRLIILESCVPRWFYAFERAVFPLATSIVNATLSHPATLQYPAPLITDLVQEQSKNVEVLRIPKGRWVLQYGFKFPSVLTPVTPYRFVARKPYPTV